MNFNFDLFIDVLWLGTLCGIIASICLTKLKKAFPFINKGITSIIINVIIGFSTSKLFTNLSNAVSIVVGVITWIGAEAISDKINMKNLFKGSVKDSVVDEEEEFKDN